MSCHHTLRLVNNTKDRPDQMFRSCHLFHSQICSQIYMYSILNKTTLQDVTLHADGRRCKLTLHVLYLGPITTYGKLTSLHVYPMKSLYSVKSSPVPVRGPVYTCRTPLYPVDAKSSCQCMLTLSFIYLHYNVHVYL